MSEIKSLADQLRSSLVVPEPISPKTTKPKATTGKAAAGDKGVDLNPKILQEILAYDTAEHKKWCMPVLMQKRQRCWAISKWPRALKIPASLPLRCTTCFQCILNSSPLSNIISKT